MIAGYNEAAKPPNNLTMIVGRKLTVRGFIVSAFAARHADFLGEKTGPHHKALTA